MPAKKKLSSRKRTFHADDLAYAVYGQRFFQGGEIATMKELRRAWKDPAFRAAVVAYAAENGRADRIFCQHDDGKARPGRFKVCGSDGVWRWTTRRPSMSTSQRFPKDSPQRAGDES